jgi:hypothetical protein
MGNNLFTYIKQIELLAFFSGYALVYCFIRIIIRHPYFTRSETVVSLLPVSYALVGIIYLGFQLMNLYPDFSFENIKRHAQMPYLFIWGLLSVFFWIPALSQKPGLSLFHSIIFFFIIAKDILFQLVGNSTGRFNVKNEMTVYTISVAVNLLAFVIVLLCFLSGKRKRLPNP